MDFYDWLEIGVKNKWVSEPYCDTHDGGPLTDKEAQELDEGSDPCMVAMRVWYV